MKKYDVAVAGGGIAGCMAAISAARAGALVLLIEKYGFLGGTLTACGTGPMMTFHAGEKLVVQGICNELVERLKAQGLSTGHIFDTTNYTYTVTPFDSEGMKRELEKMCVEAGVELLYHTCITGVERDDEKILSLELYNKSGKDKAEAKFFIDATGDCDITYLAGEKYTKGRESDGKTQPLTMNLKLYNVDVDRVRKYIKEHPEDFPCLNGDTSTIDKAPRLSMGGCTEQFKKARGEGKLSFDREGILFFETNTKNEIIVNTSRVINADPTNPRELTGAEIAGRKQTLEILNFLKEEIPGFENAIMENTGPFIGVRSSRQIFGRHILTGTELLESAEFEDTVACGGYPIDVHCPDGADETFSSMKKPSYGQIYNIPLSSMYGNLSNLITVGRCISVDFEAQAAIRVSPISGATGHAGGAAAAACVRENKSIQDIDFGKVREILKKQNAYLP